MSRVHTAPEVALQTQLTGRKAEGEITVNGATEKRDNALRRLDWRFLLPNPDPCTILYVGPAETSLWLAMQGAWPHSCLHGAAVPEGHDTRYELVAAKSPPLRELEEACRKLQPEGVLYLEAWGLLARFADSEVSKSDGGRSPAARNSTSRERNSPRVRAYRRALEQLGFFDQRLYCYVPNFEACTKIIPLDHPAALLKACPPKRRWQKLLSRMVLGSPFAATLAPFVCIVARRGGP